MRQWRKGQNEPPHGCAGPQDDMPGANYRRPLKGFLNNFVGQHRSLKSLNTDLLSERFERAAKLVQETVGKEALRRTGYQLNAALTEAIFVGLMRRLDHGEPIQPSDVGGVIASLRGDEAMESAVSRATADEENVRTRLELATSHFSRI